MDLFNLFNDKDQNLLPKDGTVNYYGRVLPKEMADKYYEVLLNTIAWKNDKAVIYGKKIITARKVAWYGNKEYAYTYSNTTKQALFWTSELLQLKQLVETLTQSAFNSCLLNLYHNGQEAMAWHSDDEKSLGKNTTIASLSFGAERRFGFKHKESKESLYLLLEHGSLLVMKDETQSNWLHRLTTSTAVIKPRINLTFRTMIE